MLVEDLGAAVDLVEVRLSDMNETVRDGHLHLAHREPVATAPLACWLEDVTGGENDFPPSTDRANMRSSRLSSQTASIDPSTSRKTEADCESHGVRDTLTGCATTSPAVKGALAVAAAAVLSVTVTATVNVPSVEYVC